MTKPGDFALTITDNAEESRSRFESRSTLPSRALVRHVSHDGVIAPREKEVVRYEPTLQRRSRRSPQPSGSGHNRDRSRERVSKKYTRERYYDSRDESPVRPDIGSRKPATAATAPPPIIVNNFVRNANDSSDDERFSRRKRNGRRHRNWDQSNESHGVDRSKEAAQPACVADPSGAHLALAQRKVNAIWEPSQESDITIRLKLPIQVDLDELLEEFCRLRILGNFSAARQFFDDHLKEHQNNPYVLVHYAEMLVEQGDYNGFSDLERSPLFSSNNEISDNEDEKFLARYCKLMRAERACSKPPASEEIFRIIPEALKSLQRITSSNSESIGSTQIKMLAKLLDMSANKRCHVYLQEGWLKRQLQNLFPDTLYRSLYLQLLRQGRIWDFRELFMSKSNADGCRAAIQAFRGKIDESRPLSAIMSDWNANGSGNDTLTTLSMIDILTTVALSNEEVIEDAMSMATSLAHTVMQSDEEGMQSESFLHWLLMRTYSAMGKDKSRVEDHHKYLASQPGMYFGHLGLPEYVPRSKENPGWRQHDASQQYLGPIRMVSDVAKSLRMYRLQMQALTILISESSHPAKEFDELCELQKTAQGDMKSYTHTLVSKYLTLSDDASMGEFRAELRDLCFDQKLQTCLNPRELWVMCLLLHSMEVDGSEAEKALETAFECSKYLERGEINPFYWKMDHLQRKYAQYLHEASPSPVERRNLELDLGPVELERRARNVQQWPEISPDTTKQKDAAEATTGSTRTKTFQSEAIRHFNSSDDRSPSRERRTDHSQNDFTRVIETSQSRSEADYQYELQRKRIDYELERLKREIETLKITESAKMAQLMVLSESQERKDDFRARMQKESSRLSKERDDLERELRDRMKEEKQREVEKAKTEQEQRLELEREATRRQESSERRLQDLMSHIIKVQDDVQAIKSQVEAEEEGPWTHFSGPPPPAPEPAPYGKERIQRIQRTRRPRIPPRIIQVDYPSSEEDSYGTADEQSGPTHMPVSDMEENGNSTSGDDEPDDSSDDSVASADPRETGGQNIPERSLSEGHDGNEGAGNNDDEHDSTAETRDIGNDSAEQLVSKPGALIRLNPNGEEDEYSKSRYEQQLHLEESGSSIPGDDRKGNSQSGSDKLDDNSDNGGDATSDHDKNGRIVPAKPHSEDSVPQ